jgi:predicted CoA-binding protein
MTDHDVAALLRASKTIAVVGLSVKPWRASHGVSRYMLSRGYRILPVNPREAEVFGEPAAPELDAVPAKVDIVNVFRRPEFVPEIAEAAIRIRAGAVWMQDGIRHEAAAERLRSAGIAVVMDRCIMIEHMRLLG